MSKKVVWEEGPYKPKRKAGTYSSYGDFLEKAERLRSEQEAAQNYLAKARPAMAKLLEIRMTNGEPLTVMRPLRYRATVLQSQLRKGQDDADALFYGGVTAATDSTRTEAEKAKNAKFIETVVTINPGTQIVLKSIDPNLQEFVFQDAVGEEHAISYADRDALMTQTDVFETVQKLMEGNKENR